MVKKLVDKDALHQPVVRSWLCPLPAASSWPPGRSWFRKYPDTRRCRWWPTRAGWFRAVTSPFRRPTRCSPTPCPSRSRPGIRGWEEQRVESREPVWKQGHSSKVPPVRRFNVTSTFTKIINLTGSQRGVNLGYKKLTGQKCTKRLNLWLCLLIKNKSLNEILAKA